MIRSLDFSMLNTTKNPMKDHLFFVMLHIFCCVWPNSETFSKKNYSNFGFSPYVNIDRTLIIPPVFFSPLSPTKSPLNLLLERIGNLLNRFWIDCQITKLAQVWFLTEIYHLVCYTDALVICQLSRNIGCFSYNVIDISIVASH